MIDDGYWHASSLINQGLMDREKNNDDWLIRLERRWIFNAWLKVIWIWRAYCRFSAFGISVSLSFLGVLSDIIGFQLLDQFLKLYDPPIHKHDNDNLGCNSFNKDELPTRTIWWAEWQVAVNHQPIVAYNLANNGWYGLMMVSNGSWSSS